MDQSALGKYAIGYQNGSNALLVGHMYINRTMAGISFDMYVDAKRVAGPLDLVIIDIIGVICALSTDLLERIGYPDVRK